MERRTYLLLNLKLFEGEGSAATGGNAPGAGESGQEGNSTTEIIYGKQDDTAQTGENTPDKKVVFQNLLKGEYKTEADEYIQNIIKNRLASERKAQDNKQRPLMDLLAQKYGVDSGSENLLDSITKAIQEDNSFWEKEAMEKGMDVEQFKQLKRLEMENASFREMAEKEQNQAKVQKLLSDAEKLRETYPEFDLEVESENDDFINLIKSNIDVKTAFEVIHHDEIMEGALRYTAQEVQKKVVNDIKARGMRPAENGTGAAASATYKQSVNDLNDTDIDEIVKRVNSGEKIKF